MDYKNGMDDRSELATIYIGGGTPSIIDSKYITEIMDLIKSNFKFSEQIEITIEVNPGTVDIEKLQNYLNCGINRLSIGLQSTNNELLKLIGRIHTYDDFEKTYQQARKVGFTNINVDLMIGLPNQQDKDVKQALEKVIGLNPEHISIYSLIIEEGTKMEEIMNEGKVNLPDENTERQMYWVTKKQLESAGYEHYEISNFAKPNFKSVHNLNCWEQKEYIGIGIAAHSYTNNIRYSNLDSIEKYIHNFECGEELDNLIFHEKQNKEAMMKEFMLLALRKIEGVSINKFKSKFIENPIFIFKNELESLVNSELIEIDGDAIRLTNKGLDLANLVWERFV